MVKIVFKTDFFFVFSVFPDSSMGADDSSMRMGDSSMRVEGSSTTVCGSLVDSIKHGTAIPLD